MAQFSPRRIAHSHITIHDKAFRPYLTAAVLDEAVTRLAVRLSADYAGREPLFVVVLTGAFMFASDLLKRMTEPCEIVFIRVASYEVTGSSGVVQEVMGLRENVQNRHLIVVEDIVDTGTTMRHLLPILMAKGPASVEIATLFFKPESLLHPLDLRYVALEIPNHFVVGYGLDYDGLGRSLPDVYVAV